LPVEQEKDQFVLKYLLIGRNTGGNKMLNDIIITVLILLGGIAIYFALLGMIILYNRYIAAPSHRQPLMTERTRPEDVPPAEADLQSPTGEMQADPLPDYADFADRQTERPLPEPGRTGLKLPAAGLPKCNIPKLNLPKPGRTDHQPPEPVDPVRRELKKQEEAFRRRMQQRDEELLQELKQRREESRVAGQPDSSTEPVHPTGM